MNKRKIFTLALAVMMVAILAIGGTMAYFTSEDSADNVFTIGNVQIDLKENFEKEEADLVPGLDINKDVWVENTGANDAYVRVHIAFPAAMDDGNPEFNASKNFLHWNFVGANFAAGKWSWIPKYTEDNGYLGNGAGNWNYYETTIDGEEYAVYVATYRSVLAPGAATETALDKVYLDDTVDAVVNEDGSVTYTDTKGNTVTLTAEETQNIQVKVFAEGTQVETFENAYEALNTAFGVPGTYNPWDAE